MFRPAREPQSKRHVRNSYYVLGEGIFNDPGTSSDAPVEPSTPSTIASLRKFRFSRLSPVPGTTVTSRTVREALAKAMTPDPAGPAGESPDSSRPAIPAGFTYLGQFVDHDLTLDATIRDLEQDVTVEELIQGRSPALDLDSLYGRGPQKPQDRKFYGPDGIRLRTGRTQPVGGDPDGVNDVPQQELDGFDLPRIGIGSSIGERRAALIPDPRNDENLAVAQIHCAFIRFHNKVVSDLAAKGTDSAVLFDTARELVVKHYQWMLRTDYLIQIVDDQIVDDVFTHGRRYFDVAPEIRYDDGAVEDDTYRTLQPGDAPTMPIEFSVAAFRLGHSMVRAEYEWNRVFNSGQGPGVIAPATLRLIFVFSATSGNFQPFPPDDDNPDAGTAERLPTNWVADLPRLFDFSETGRKELMRTADQFNLAKRIDTLLVDVLKQLPLGSFGARGATVPEIERNLAFRNLTRANMLKLATGQEMAEFFKLDEDERLTEDEIERGSGDGASLAELSPEDLELVRTKTPLWFYILREAEVKGGGRLTGVGGRIVAEVFHRAMEGSKHSIVRDPEWRPTLAVDQSTFRMSDLLLYAFEGKAELLNPLGPPPGL
ncbi:heme peroxidase family protein [Streptomyces xiangluensis]|uniref:Heme peroxidase family protein n=1 Tax=Streptomyces xiangluensis TaxID=2665720 RepID=A0ABV8YRN5_9ACTN